MEKKPKYYNEYISRGTQKYLAKNKQEIRFWAMKGDKERLIEAANQAGYTAFSRFIIDAINEKAGRIIITVPMEREAFFEKRRSLGAKKDEDTEKEIT